MAKHYGGQERSPLLTGRYLDIHMAILDLLGETGWLRNYGGVLSVGV